MRSLQRVLLERKTRRFVDEMILKYADIRLSSARRELSRKRPRSEASSVHKSARDQDEERAEKSTSSGCRTESEQSSTMVDSTTAAGRQDEERWRFSDARTASVSEYGSAFSSTRLTRLLEEEDGDGERSREATALLRGESDPGSEACSEENQEHHSSYLDCDASSACFESAPPSTNQTECGSQVSGCQAETPSSSPTTSAPESRLPGLRPRRPENRVVPNCCDFFTSPHPHYEKEAVGKGDDDSSSLQTNSTRSDTTSVAADDENEGRSDASTRNNEDGDEFEMWDYVCPQYVRHVYRNQWV
jgi:hypothetical protein